MVERALVEDEHLVGVRVRVRVRVGVRVGVRVRVRVRVGVRVRVRVRVLVEDEHLGVAVLDERGDLVLQAR